MRASEEGPKKISGAKKNGVRRCQKGNMVAGRKKQIYLLGAHHDNIFHSDLQILWPSEILNVSPENYQECNSPFLSPWKSKYRCSLECSVLNGTPPHLGLGGLS